ncbi:MAG: gliding motility protein GldN [Muribaculaceae bacterium]|nr:gliding motility protein GldN [Muribaculaceae bacterium]
MNSIFKRLSLAAAALVVASTALAQQQSSTSTLSRNGSSRRDRDRQENGAPQITQRLQLHYDDAGKSITDADRQWMRVIYREIDLDKDKNAALYFPEDKVDDQENLFRIIMRLVANNQIPVYEYLDGREIFTDQYRVKVRDLLDRFHVPYSEAKGSTERNPRFNIDEADVPTTEVLSYFIIERWEFDTRNNRMTTVVDAICPVLHRSGDFGGEAIKYPMFWVKYSDLRPWLAQQTIFTSDENNLPQCTYDDFFTLNKYEGDIYKTRNLRNRSMMQMYPDADDLKRAQDSIQTQLTKFEEKLWVPDREEVIGKGKKGKDAESDVAAKESDSDNGPAVAGESDATVSENEEAAERTPKRATKRSAKKKEPKKYKEQKSSGSKSATRSVRRRK